MKQEKRMKLREALLEAWRESVRKRREECQAAQRHAARALLFAWIFIVAGVVALTLALSFFLD